MKDNKIFNMFLVLAIQMVAVIPIQRLKQNLHQHQHLK